MRLTVSTVFISILGLMVLSIYSCDNSASLSTQTEDPGVINSNVFRSVPSSESGITFQNVLEEGLNTNILMYEYFYNGGGVAVGDFNGDDLLDIYFTSNMGDNIFYINKGDMHFEDVTKTSKATGRSGPWKTGVNASDVNGDGRLDLYICYSGALPDEKRKNQLYLNMGNDQNDVPIFQESATQLGLASPGFSTQSYFFDYDLDGDLDMLLLNHNPKNLPILNEAKTKVLLKADNPLYGVRLYNQDKGRFRDLTKESKISSSELTYGLGIGIGDFNNDGWPDFYVSNDYSVPDYLYINRQDGSFENQLPSSIGHTSQFSMGNDIGDINNDGLQDIITLDMLPEDNKRQKLLLAPDEYSKFDLNVRSGFYYQYMRNMLHVNNGNGTFSEIGQYADISNTDWSWSALLADYDNDGRKDLYVTNGYFRDYTNLDFINYMNDLVQKKGRLKREDVIEIVNNMPSSDLSNYMYKGSGKNKFVNVTAEWSMDQKANSNGASYADLDNDGDLDLIVNNINKAAFLYENYAFDNLSGNYLQVALKGSGKNTYGIGSRINVYVNDEIYMLEQNMGRGYQSSVSPILHFGLGSATNVDSLMISWPGGSIEKIYKLKTNTRITLDQANSRRPIKLPQIESKKIFTSVDSPISYEHVDSQVRDFDRQSLLLSEISEDGPCMVKGDLDENGLEDIYIGGESGRPGIVYNQTSPGVFTKMLHPEFLNDAGSEDCDAVIFDANSDGFLDLYVASGGYYNFNANDPLLKDRLYINSGSGQFIKSESSLPDMNSSNSCIAESDINQDGFADLFVGGRVIPGRYPEVPESVILINDGTGKFENKTDEVAPDLQKIGMVSDAIWIDVNEDSIEDLIVVGEWMPISIFINKNGILEDATERILNKPTNGFWNVIATADLNRDNKPDFIVGNSGTNLQIKASDTQPAEMYYSDFDNNGSVDPILNFYIHGRSYPYITRDELKRQLPSLGSRFPSYESFSSATINDLFSARQLNTADYLKVDRLETTLILSTSDGSYEMRSLPHEVQYAPIHVIEVLDFDDDGYIDLLLCGNNSKLKLRLGQSDANYGVLLKGDGNGSFEYVNQINSGLKITGDVRSVIVEEDLFLFGLKGKPMVAYRLNDAEKL